MIRDAIVEDADELGALRVRAWHAAYADLLAAAELDSLDPEEDARAWREYLLARPPEHRLWLVVEDGRILGYARTGPCRDANLTALRAGELFGIYVEPERIGTGVGRALLEHVLEDFANRGFRVVVLWHFAANERAAAFYDRAGIALDGARRASRFGVDEVRRRRELRAPGSDPGLTRV